VDYFKEFENKSILHISDSDLDGVSSRIVGEWYLKPYSKIYTPLNTGERQFTDFDFSLAEQYDIIIFTDIAPPSIEFIEKLGKEKVFIFDHHQTSRDVLGDLDRYVFSLDMCGAKLFYTELLKGRSRRKAIIDRYIELTNIYDMWKIESDDWNSAKYLNYILYGYVNWNFAHIQKDTEKYEKFINIQLSKFVQYDNFFFTNYEKRLIEKALQREEQAYLNSKKKLQFRIDNEGNTYAYTECSTKVSITASKLLNELNDKIVYIAILNTFDKNDLKVSLRSLGNFDTTYITEKWSGGGHKNASAFKFQNNEDLENFRSGKIHLI